MTEARFHSARVSPEGLTVSWSDVPAPEEQGELLLSLLTARTDGSTVQFGTRWIRDAEDSPIVFAWDSRAVQQRDHESAASAIERDGGAVHVLFPRTWFDSLVDADSAPAEAVVTIDGTDVSSADLTIEKD
jgi:hypothetical protein